MTQFDEKVEEVRRQNEAREWAKQVKQIYAHDGVTEIHYNSGKVTHFLGLTMLGRSIEMQVIAGDSWKTIYDRFSRAMVDRGIYG